jgi:hypothetical protein
MANMPRLCGDSAVAMLAEDGASQDLLWLDTEHRDKDTWGAADR